MTGAQLVDLDRPEGITVEVFDTSTKFPTEIVEGVREEDYRSMVGANASLLKMFNRTPAHARASMVEPGEPSDAMQLGTLFHAVLLNQPLDRFSRLEKGLDRRSTPAKDAKKVGVFAVKTFEVEAVDRMAREVRGHQSLGELIAAPSARAEVVLKWYEDVKIRDGQGGHVWVRVPCKAKLDLVAVMGSTRWIMDAKSCEDAAEIPFQKTVENLGYFEQAAWYLRGMNKMDQVCDTPDGGSVLIEANKFVFAAVESKPPFLPNAHELTEELLEWGAARNQRNLETLAECVYLDNWPGYENGIGTVGLSRWGADKRNREFPHLNPATKTVEVAS
jgi:hypothetical protein